jgi:hypothetical protein
MFSISKFLIRDSTVATSVFSEDKNGTATTNVSSEKGKYEITSSYDVYFIF